MMMWSIEMVFMDLISVQFCIREIGFSAAMAKSMKTLRAGLNEVLSLQQKTRGGMVSFVVGGKRSIVADVDGSEELRALGAIGVDENMFTTREFYSLMNCLDSLDFWYILLSLKLGTDIFRNRLLSLREHKGRCSLEYTRSMVFLPRFRDSGESYSLYIFWAI